MSNNVDNKIVSITFDNRVFENRVSQTLSTLSDLNRSIQSLDKTTGLNNLDVSKISNGVDDIRSKFSTMGVVGFQVISRLTNAAIDFAASMAKFSWDTIMGGGKIRAENIEQARFMLQGLNVDVEAVMASALKAVEGTAYGLDAAAKAAAQFSASGIEAGDEMTGALRAIAGTAAMTNTSFEEMSGIFTSAAGRGKVMGQQLMQFSHRGLNAAAIMGEQWGKTEAEVREMASRSEISFEMFYQAMDQAFGAHAQKANETYSGSLANLKAALARVGASFFGARLEHQRDTFNSITPMVNALHDALMPVIHLFVLLSKQSSVGLVKIFHRLTWYMDYFKIAVPGIVRGMANLINLAKALVKPLTDAFGNVFGSNLANNFYEIVFAFIRFTEAIKMGFKGGDNLRRIFEGLFSVVRIVWEVARLLIQTVLQLFGAFASGRGSILQFVAIFGDVLVGIRKFLVDGGALQKVFGAIQAVLVPVVRAIAAFRDAVLGLVFGAVGKAVSGVFTGIKKSAEGMGAAFAGAVDLLKTIFSAIFGTFGDLQGALVKLTYLGFGPLVNVVFKLRGVWNTFYGALIKVKDAVVDFGREIKEKLAGPLEEITGKFQAIGAGITGFGSSLKSLLSGGGVSSMESLSKSMDAITGNFKGLGSEAKIAGMSFANSFKMPNITMPKDGFGIQSLVGSTSAISESVFGRLSEDTRGTGGMITGETDKMKQALSGIYKFSAVLQKQKPKPLSDVLGGAIGAKAGLAEAAMAGKDSSGVLERVMSAIMGFPGKIWGAIKSVGEAIKTFFKTIFTKEVFEGGMDVARLGIVYSIIQLIRDFRKAAEPFVGLSESFAGVLDEVGGAIKAFTLKTKAEALVKIAIAIGGLAVSIIALAFVPIDKVIPVLTLLAASIGALIAPIAALNKMEIGSSPKKIAVVAVSMIALAAAMVLMALAVNMLKDRDWGEIGIALATMAGGLAAFMGAVYTLSKMSNDKALGEILKVSVSISIMAVGLLLLAKVVERFDDIDFGQTVSSLSAIGIGLRFLAAAMTAMPEDMLRRGVGFVLTIGALNMMGDAIVKFAKIKWGDMKKGGLAISAALIVITASMRAMPKDMEQIGLSLVGLAAALYIMSMAIERMAAIPMDPLAASMSALVILLAALVIAANAMNSAAVGAGSLLVIAGALMILANVLAFVGLLPFDILIAGIGGIMLALIGIGLTAAALSALSPFIMTFALALTVLGAALLLFSVAAFVGATALGLFAKDGIAGLDAFLQFVDGMLQKLAEFAASIATFFVLLIVETLKNFVEALPAIFGLLDDALDELVAFIVRSAPKVGAAIQAVIDTFLQVVEDSIPGVVDIGITLIMSLAQGVRDNIGEFVTLVAEIIIEFINALGDQIDPLVDAILDFLSKVFFRIGYLLGNAEYIKAVGGSLIKGIVFGMVNLADEIWKGLKEIIEGAIYSFKQLLGINSPSTVFADFGRDIIQGLINGIKFLMGALKKIFIDIPIDILKWIGNLTRTLWDKGWDLLKGLLNGIENVATDLWNFFSGISGKITGYFVGAGLWLWNLGKDVIDGLWGGIKSIWEGALGLLNWFANIGDMIVGKVKETLGLARGGFGVLWDVGKDIIDGFWEGVKGVWDDFVDWLWSQLGALPGIIKKFFEIFSPSRVMMKLGEYVGEGFAIGLKDSFEGAAEVFNQSTKLFDPSIFDIALDVIDINPTITPVIDLSEVEQGAARMGHILDAQHVVDPSVSLANAREISRVELAGKEAPAEPVSSTTVLEFNQTINAPEALSTADIYRQTKGQVALAKEELHIP